MKKYIKADSEKTHMITIKGCEKFYFKRKLEVTEEEYYILTHLQDYKMADFEWQELYGKLRRIAEQDATKDYVDHDYEWQVYKANGRNILEEK